MTVLSVHLGQELFLGVLIFFLYLFETLGDLGNDVVDLADPICSLCDRVLIPEDVLGLSLISLPEQQVFEL